MPARSMARAGAEAAGGFRRGPGGGRWQARGGAGRGGDSSESASPRCCAPSTPRCGRWTALPRWAASTLPGWWAGPSRWCAQLRPRAAPFPAGRRPERRAARAEWAQAEQEAARHASRCASASSRAADDGVLGFFCRRRLPALPPGRQGDRRHYACRRAQPRPARHLRDRIAATSGIVHLYIAGSDDADTLLLHRSDRDVDASSCTRNGKATPSSGVCRAGAGAGARLGRPSCLQAIAPAAHGPVLVETDLAAEGCAAARCVGIRQGPELPLARHAGELAH